MNLDNKHIDNIFREGLDSHTEVPSGGLWKKISGRMLWYELAHFNFTNIPVGWIGFAAAAVVVTGMMFYTLSPSVTPVEVGGNETITAKTDQLPSNTTIVTDSEKESTSANRTFIDDISKQTQITSPDVLQDDYQILIDGSVVEAPGEREFITDKGLNDPKQRDARLETPVEVVEQTPVGAQPKTETFDQKDEAGLQDEVVTAVTLDDTEINPGNASENQISRLPQIYGGNNQQLAHDMEAGRMGAFAGVAGETELDEMGIAALEKRAGTGKIQKMHSLSFSLGQILKGKYRPPKRDFNGPGKGRKNNSIISVSAYFAPEFTEYARTASSSREMSYLAGAALQYSNSKYLLQGGLEFSYSNDIGDYQVDMKTYDSTGFYHDVGSFIVDPNNPDSIIWQTTVVTTYDSVQHFVAQQTQNHYTYLQFPLMVGYKAVERGIFSAYIKAGPTFAFLLEKSEPRLNYYNPDANVQCVNNYTPSRFRTNIQVLVSLALHLQMTENFGIIVEPTYRYYVKSVYNGNEESLKNPYGVGIRGGLFYNF